MTRRAPTPRVVLSDKCRAVAIKDGRTLICWRSPGHVDSKTEARRKHYDPSADKYWTG